MTTKVTVIGDKPGVRKLQKIKFIKVLNGDGEIERAPLFQQPDGWSNIELVCRKYTTGKERTRMDLMFAYDNNRTAGCMYLGYFNDGVVE